MLNEKKMNEAGANSHPISPLWPTIGGQWAVAAGWQRVLWPVGHGVWSLESGLRIGHVTTI
jgi:hypothetical protein